jgi:hypothetical protein
LKPLDEAVVRDALRSPPGDIEAHGGAGDEQTWAGDAVSAEFLLARSEDGVLRSVELGLTTTGYGDYAAEFAAVASSLAALADRVGGRLYREPFDRSARLGPDEIAELAAAAARSEPTRPSRVPRLLVDFSELGDEEAAAYLEQHVARAPERLTAFRREVSLLGGPGEAELDATPESLARLGEWLFRSLPARYAGALEPAASEPTGTAPIVQLTPPEWRTRRPDEPDELPPWCGPDAERARSPLPPQALWLADGLGYYLAECLARELGDVGWTVYRAASRRLRDVDEGAPVLATARGRYNAHSHAYTVLLVALAYRRDDPGMLPRMWRSALEGLGGT